MSLKSKIIKNEPLSKHTIFKIGGPADFFAVPKNTADLKKFILQARKAKLPILLLGAGSNILANDSGIRGMVVCLSQPFFKKIKCRGNSLEVGCGLALAQLVKNAQACGLSGVEFLAGIPGTVGGALCMNAGAWGKNIAEIVEIVRIMDYNGTIKSLKRKQIKFSYRRSGLGKYIILSARLKLQKADKGEIRYKVKNYLEQRKITQDRAYPNAGCVFKNHKNSSAGKLIDLCGLKGKRQGGAGISFRHANFILNIDHAKAEDVLTLMRLIQKKVKEKFNIALKPEIKIWK